MRRRIKKTMSHQLNLVPIQPFCLSPLRFGTIPQPSPKKKGSESMNKAQKITISVGLMIMGL